MANMATSLSIGSLAAAQSPDCQLCSMTAMMFCMNSEGMELTMAFMTMHTMASGSMTG